MKKTVTVNDIEDNDPQISFNIAPKPIIQKVESVHSLASESSCQQNFAENKLSRDYALEHDKARFTEKTQKVYTFIKIPKEVERFMMYGFFQCLDAFLFIFTLLPLRICISFVKAFLRLFVSPRLIGSSLLLEPGQVGDILKGIILVSCFMLLSHFDVSMIYHLIRGQAIIKLYIFFNMLEVADKLFSSFGQDILDSLFWTATESCTKKRHYFIVLLHLILAIIYVFLHSLLVLMQATTLNVAFNSHNKALLTIMMSNNFVEIKGSVFKKFGKNDLFQMSCSDVRERFHYVLLLAIVCIRNMAEFNWNLEHLWTLIPDVLLVLFAEILVDWTKHAFITKFNHIRCEVYREYTTSIAFDMVDSRQKNAIADHLDVISRRMGFIPLPLAVILVWVVMSSVRDCTCGVFCITLLMLFYVCLLTSKLLNSIILLGIACDLVTEAQRLLQQQQEKSPRARSKSAEPMGEEMRERTASFTRRMQRSRSIGSHINFKFPDYEPTLSGRLDRHTTTEFRQLSNSTVSLESVGLNEEYLKVKALFEGSNSNSDNNSGELRRRQTNALQLVLPVDNPPLSEVDRYTMCNNRIAT